MPGLFDWIDSLSKPSDDPALKAIAEQRNMIESLKSGEYIKTINPEDMPIEKQLAELQKLREEFSQYRAEEAAYHAAEEHRTKVAERKGFLRGVIATLVVTIIGNLFSYYWPSVVKCVTSFFQSPSPPA